MKCVGIFYKLGKKLPHCILKQIYFAFVHPHILYGIELCANTASVHLNELVLLNNKLEATQRWSAICHMWPWTLTYQKFLLCIS